jgi:hypothetical protein
VVDELLSEDLVRRTPAARAAIEPMVAELHREGVPFEWLLRCEAEGRDATRLKGCVKLYIPRPAGQWGAVLTGDEEAGKPALRAPLVRRDFANADHRRSRLRRMPTAGS